MSEKRNGRHLRMAQIGTRGRTRTPADQRRLLFQSLATRRVAHDVAHLRRHHGRWYADVGELLADTAKPNRDDNGDKMFTTSLTSYTATYPTTRSTPAAATASGHSPGPSGPPSPFTSSPSRAPSGQTSSAPWCH